MSCGATPASSPSGNRHSSGLAPTHAGLIFTHVGFSSGLCGCPCSDAGIVAAASRGRVSRLACVRSGARPPLYGSVVTLALPIVVKPDPAIGRDTSPARAVACRGSRASTSRSRPGSGSPGAYTRLALTAVRGCSCAATLAGSWSRSARTSSAANTSASTSPRQDSAMIGCALRRSPATPSLAAAGGGRTGVGRLRVRHASSLIWVALGGRGTLIGPVIGTLILDLVSTYLSGRPAVRLETGDRVAFVVVIVALPRASCP